MKSAPRTSTLLTASPHAGVGMRLVSVVRLGSSTCLSALARLAPVLLLGLLSASGCNPSPEGTSPELLREVASRLSSVGVKGEAARYYERYLERADLPGEKRAPVGLALARLLKEDGQLERALGYLYLVEQWSPGSPSAKDAAPLIVEILEKLGRAGAAQTALSSRSKLSDGAAQQPAKSPPTDGPVVARIDSEPITLAAFDEAVQSLPEQLQKQLEAPEARQRFLQEFVAEELLYRKAQKRAVDREPEVRRQIEALARQVVIGKMLQTAVQERVKVDEGDLRNYFTANAARFKGADGKDARFEDVRESVQQAYLGEKVRSISQELLKEAQSTQEVQLFPEVLAPRGQRSEGSK